MFLADQIEEYAKSFNVSPVPVKNVGHVDPDGMFYYEFWFTPVMPVEFIQVNLVITPEGATIT